MKPADALTPPRAAGPGRSRPHDRPRKPRLPSLLVPLTLLVLGIGSGCSDGTIAGAGPNPPPPPPPPGPGPTPGGVVMLGAWGCSLVTNVWQAFGRNPAPFETWSGFNWGGRSLENWHAALSNPTGGHWADFEEVADAHPSTTDLYAEICVRDASLPEATLEGMTEEVFREMRARLGPGVRLWASGMANWEEGGCLESMGEAAVVAARMADHVTAVGLAGRGPTLSPWQPGERDPNDGCHPNAAGEDRAAAEIVEFFTD